MDSARIALAALATLGSGIALGLAANPTMRTFPEMDWRARYRAANPAPPSGPQPGISYFGDGSTAWVFGGTPERVTYAPPPPALHDEPERWMPQPPPDLPPDDFDVQASAAERAAAQAAVSAALVRSDPRPDRADQPDPAMGDEPEPDEGEPGG